MNNGGASGFPDKRPANPLMKKLISVFKFLLPTIDIMGNRMGEGSDRVFAKVDKNS